MASSAAISAVGKGLERALSAWFESSRPLGTTSVTAKLVQTEDFASNGARIGQNKLSLFLYRIELNRAMRPAWAQVAHMDGRGRVPLDLHFLVTAWSDNAEHEHQILGAAMEYLEQNPILAGPMLDPQGGWAAAEAVQIVLGEMTTEEVMRTFDSLPTDYRLSVPYVVRVVRVDSRIATPDPPVTMIVTGTTPSSERDA